MAESSRSWTCPDCDSTVANCQGLRACVDCDWAVTR